jgi:hypothetical protein
MKYFKLVLILLSLRYWAFPYTFSSGVALSFEGDLYGWSLLSFGLIYIWFTIATIKEFLS